MPLSELIFDQNRLPELRGSRCILRPLLVEHVSEHYVAWLNDPEVNRFLESRFALHSLDSVRAFVAYQRSSGCAIFYGIWSMNETHIGNIKFGPIDDHHLTSDLGFLIGNRNYWGKGIASEAISLMVNFGFDCGLEKITAGSYENNIGSTRALQKAGFLQEGFRVDQVVSNGKRIGVTLFGLIKHKSGEAEF